MALVGPQAVQARDFLNSDFAQSFPRGFRALQDMAVAGSNAYKNNGKRAWFGLGRDLSLETMRQFQDSVTLLVIALKNDEFINLPAAKGMSEPEQINRLVALFFTAYSNWPDAEAAWEIVGQGVMNGALRSNGY